MIIVGTGGLGLETMGMLVKEKQAVEITFYDENPNGPTILYERFRVIRNYDELKEHFRLDNHFVVAIGHPRTREKVFKRMLEAGGQPTNAVSLLSSVWPFNPEFSGCIIQPGAGISHGVLLGTGCAVHINSTIGHKVKVGNFVNIAPSATIIGPCEIGDYTYISAQAIVMPNVKIGKNVLIKVGSIVNCDIPDYGEM